MAFSKTVLVCFLIIVPFSETQADCNGRTLTKQQVNAIKNKQSDIIQGDRIPQVMRLAFHICVGELEEWAP